MPGVRSLGAWTGPWRRIACDLGTRHTGIAPPALLHPAPALSFHALFEESLLRFDIEGIGDRVGGVALCRLPTLKRIGLKLFLRGVGLAPLRRTARCDAEQYAAPSSPRRTAKTESCDGPFYSHPHQLHRIRKRENVRRGKCARPAAARSSSATMVSIGGRRWTLQTSPCSGEQSERSHDKPSTPRSRTS